MPRSVHDTFQQLRDQEQKHYRNALGTPQNAGTKGRNTPRVRLVSDYAWRWFYINVGRLSGEDKLAQKKKKL